MTNLLIAIVGLAVGAALMWLLKRGDIKALQARLDSERLHAQKSAEDYARQLNEERQRAQQLRNESDKQWTQKLAALRQELLKTTAEQLTANATALRQSNDDNISQLLQPLRQQFDDFKKAVDESNTLSVLSKKSIEDKFAEALHMFQIQQENSINRLKEETARIGNDAVALAKALKSNTKRQGNWGEMVLKTMLENSGLEEGVHFFVQYNVADDEGKRNIPDVVIRFPEGRSVVIDSKVSLTAYTEYFETDDEDRQRLLLRNHLKSVEKHVDELSEKKYQRIVKDSMDYVLMFIPNESSYVAAVKLNPNLLRDAYAKKVIIISPNNLMMALQLAFNLWQTDKQVKNIEKIVVQGTRLYEKVSTFKDTFDDLGRRINALQNVYETSHKQLFSGKGNVLRQCEQLREYGVQPDNNKIMPPDTTS